MPMYKNALILIKCAAFFNFSVLFLMENNEIHFCNPNKKAPKKNRNKTTKPKNNSHLSSSTDVHIPTVTNTKNPPKKNCPTYRKTFLNEIYHFIHRLLVLYIYSMPIFNTIWLESCPIF